MLVRIELARGDGTGRITPGSEVSLGGWNRLRDLVLGVQSDALISGKQIDLEWASVLAIAPALGDLRRELGIVFQYNEDAKADLTRYSREAKQVRARAGQHRIDNGDLDVARMLWERGFNRRRLVGFQDRDLRKMIALSNAANFSVPGAGKTTVALATYLLTRDRDTGLLIVAPKNAFGAWDDVITDCLDPELAEGWRFTRLEGGHSTIADRLRRRPLRALISYDQLARSRPLVAALLNVRPYHVILDESHRIKAGDRAARGAACRRISHLPVRRDILSGTPIPHSFDDIVPQLEFLWPGHGVGQAALLSPRPQEFLRPYYVRTTKDDLQLPPVARSFPSVSMSPAQEGLYSILRQQTIARLAGIKGGGQVDIASARRSIMRLLQASSNPILLMKSLGEDALDSSMQEDRAIQALFGAIVEERDSPKVREVARLARESVSQGGRVVIWSMFTGNVERLAELLADEGAQFIHGGVPTGDKSDLNTREGRIAAFHVRDGPCRVLVANPAACSEGISLHTVCHTAIYLDRSFNAAHYLQSVDRIHRLGLPQGTETNIIVVESVAPGAVGAVDYSVRRRLIAKLRVMADALDDPNLEKLAMDEDGADAPLDWDITLEDVADVIAELQGEADSPGEEEAL